MKDGNKNNIIVFNRLKDGYSRSTIKGSSTSYMYDILSNSINRTVWNKICQKTICKILGHMKSVVCVEKGHTNTLGDFEVSLCKLCRCRVLFYERHKNERY